MLANKLKGSSGSDKTYIEDVFSTYLYTGNGSTQTINNGIDLAGKGGMVWIKDRTYNGNQNYVQDTVRGITNALVTNSTAASAIANVSSASGTGFTLNNTYVSDMNYSGLNLVSWTFRKAPKFFDVVTYAGNGASTQTISHSLGQVPGMIIIKKTSGASALGWTVWHRSLTDGNYLLLNSTSAQTFDSVMQGANAPTATTFTAELAVTDGLNGSGTTYVAYLFAHDTTTDGLIQCGSFSGTGDVNLGWEPQYILIKPYSQVYNWIVIDNMRGFTAGPTNSIGLNPNTTSAESDGWGIKITPTGFTNTTFGGAYPCIYMAIRRGPMRTPTDGTKVFTPVVRTGTGVNTTVPSEFVTDTVIQGNMTSTLSETKYGFWDRLRANRLLYSLYASAEVVAHTSMVPENPWDVMKGYKIGNGSASFLTNTYPDNYIDLFFRRAPGFFDVVCYTGTGVARTVNHNLNVPPELIIVKNRTGTYDWLVWHKLFANNINYRLLLRTDTARLSGDIGGAWSSPVAGTSTFGLGASSNTNNSGISYVAYLFASCPGVSKVGSYTGNGTSQTIDCGFSAGARFVLIKRTDSTGDWYVWDTARGIVDSNDPYLSLNTTAAEVTTDDTVDPNSTGFIVNQVAATNVNVSGASYIFLSIA